MFAPPPYVGYQLKIIPYRNADNIVKKVPLSTLLPMPLLRSLVLKGVGSSLCPLSYDKGTFSTLYIKIFVCVASIYFIFVAKRCVIEYVQTSQRGVR